MNKKSLFCLLTILILYSCNPNIRAYRKENKIRYDVEYLNKLHFIHYELDFINIDSIGNLDSLLLVSKPSDVHCRNYSNLYFKKNTFLLTNNTCLNSYKSIENGEEVIKFNAITEKYMGNFIVNEKELTISLFDFYKFGVEQIDSITKTATLYPVESISSRDTFVYKINCVKNNKDVIIFNLKRKRTPIQINKK